MGNINDPNDPYYRDLAGWVFRNGQWQDNTAERNAFREQNGVAPTADGRNAPGGPQPLTPTNPGTNPTAVGGLDKGYQVNAGLGNLDQQWVGELGNMLKNINARQSIGMDNTMADQTRGAQTGLITDLQNQAAGIGPSLAQAQLAKASDQNLANTLSAIQSTRGMGATAAAGQAQAVGANAGQSMAQDSAILRLQEQMQARGMLGQLATGTRGQDIGQAAQQAQIALQDRAQTDAIRDQLIGKGMSWAQAEQQARAQVAQMNQQGRIAATQGTQNQQQINNQASQFDRQQGAQESQFALQFITDILKMIMRGAGGAAGAGAVTGG